MTPQTKICVKCSNDLPLDAFSPDESKRDGLRSQCRACRSKRIEVVAAPDSLKPKPKPAARKLDDDDHYTPNSCQAERAMRWNYMLCKNHLRYQCAEAPLRAKIVERCGYTTRKDFVHAASLAWSTPGLKPADCWTRAPWWLPGYRYIPAYATCTGTARYDHKAVTQAEKYAQLMEVVEAEAKIFRPALVTASTETT